MPTRNNCMIAHDVVNATDYYSGCQVVQERHVANMMREIDLRVSSGTRATENATIRPNGANTSLVTVLLDARNHPSTEAWMRIKGARQLLCPGVTLDVTAVENASVASSTAPLVATRIAIRAVLPYRTQYLARLFSFSLSELHQLFPSELADDGYHDMANKWTMTYTTDQQLPAALIVACAPCSPNELWNVYRLVQSERAAGNAAQVWKLPELQDLAQAAGLHQQADAPGKTEQVPHVPRRVRQALERMERAWCRPGIDHGTAEALDRYTFDPTTHSYSSGINLPGGGRSPPRMFMEIPTAVDPSYNLPNPADARRQVYIQQRKRPQVQWMLQQVLQLLQLETNNETPTFDETKQGTINNTNNPRRYLVEIGGGRGYLAHAVAASLLQQQQEQHHDNHQQQRYHILVVDYNEQSLHAGQERARQAGLWNESNNSNGTGMMSFVLCNIQDLHLHLPTTNATIQLVFGLHCCGGLAEAAVELALKHGASFCISTCCFRSNPELAGLTRHAKTMVEEGRISIMATTGQEKSDDLEQPKAPQETIAPLLQQHEHDVAHVSWLAACVGGQGQHRAMRAYNDMRLVAAQDLFCKSTGHHNHTGTTKSEPNRHNQLQQECTELTTRQDCFPVEYSVQNRVLIGRTKLMSMQLMISLVLLLQLFSFLGPASAFCGHRPLASSWLCRPEFVRLAAHGQSNDVDPPPERLSYPGRELSRGAFLFATAGALVTAATAKPNPASAAESAASLPTTPGATLTISTQTSTRDDNSQKTLEETISGFVAGGALTVTKTVVKYPLDTATVRLQMPNSDFSIRQMDRLFEGSFRGITAPLLSNIPAGAVFFAVKDATKQILKTNAAALPRWASTSLAVFAASLPYWAIRNPSEVIKTRQQALVAGYVNVSAWQAFQNVRGGANNATTSGLGDLYVGYWENIAYGFPADVAKFVLYDTFSGGRKDLSPAEGAMLGAASTALAQLVTTPLDVVRNRIMARTTAMDKGGGSNSTEVTTNSSYVDALATLAREEGLPGLFAGASPRVGKALLSGAIQFATYEETKQTIAKWFESNVNSGNR